MPGHVHRLYIAGTLSGRCWAGAGRVLGWCQTEAEALRCVPKQSYSKSAPLAYLLLAIYNVTRPRSRAEYTRRSITGLVTYCLHIVVLFDHIGTARRPAAAVLAPVPVPRLRLEADLGRVPAVPLGLHRDDARLHVTERRRRREQKRRAGWRALGAAEIVRAHTSARDGCLL